MTEKEKGIIIDNTIEKLNCSKNDYWYLTAKNEILEITKDWDSLDKNKLISEINKKSINANLTQKTVFACALVIIENLDKELIVFDYQLNECKFCKVIGKESTASQNTEELFYCNSCKKHFCKNCWIKNGENTIDYLTYKENWIISLDSEDPLQPKPIKKNKQQFVLNLVQIST